MKIEGKKMKTQKKNYVTKCFVNKSNDHVKTPFRIEKWRKMEKNGKKENRKKEKPLKKMMSLIG